MPLTAAEKLGCFEILEAYWDTTLTITNGFGVELTLNQLDVLKNDITTRLNALDADSVIRVSALVAEWESIRLATLNVQSGSDGQVTGVNLDFEKQQARVRKLLHTYIPVMHIAESIRQQAGPVGLPQMSFGICRL